MNFGFRISDFGLRPCSFIESSLKKCLLSISICMVMWGCAGTMKQDQAARLIAAQLSVPVEHVQVDSMSTMGNNVLADVTLKVSFALQKNQQGEWQIYRVRTTSGWEPPEGFRQNLVPTALSRSLSSAFLAELQSQ